MNTLKHISKTVKQRNAAKNKTGKNIPRYKKSSNGKCPDQDHTNTLYDAYWNEFGCVPQMNREEREIKGKNAYQCAAERLSDIYDRIDNKKPIDVKHIRPIKLAYEMGKNCLENTLYSKAYIEKFKKYYKELIKGHPEVHLLFQTQFGDGDNPLNMNAKNINKRIQSSIRTNSSQISNPIIFTNKNNKTRNNIQTPQNSNKTLKQNVLRHTK